MLIEGIRIFYPNLYDIIHKNPDIFVKRYEVWANASDREQQTKQVIKSAMNGISEQDQQAAISLLRQLFPTIDGAFGGMRYADNYVERWTAERRVTSPAYFQRYFSYAITEGQISDRELSDFTTGLIAKTDVENIDILKRLIGTRNAAYVVGKLRVAAETLDAKAAVKLANAVITDGTIYPNPEQLMQMAGPFSQAAMLVSDLIGRVTLLEGKEEGCRVAMACVENAQPLEFSWEVSWWVRFEKDGEESDAISLPKEERKRINSVVVEQIKKKLADSESLLATPLKELVRYLTTWALAESREATSEFIAGIIESNPRFTLTILDGLRPTAWDLRTGIPHKRDLDRSDYDKLAISIKPDIIYQSLEKQYGPYQRTGDYPRNFEGKSSDQYLAEQFCWLHCHVLEESAE